MREAATPKRCMFGSLNLWFLNSYNHNLNIEIYKYKKQNTYTKSNNIYYYTVENRPEGNCRPAGMASAEAEMFEARQVLGVEERKEEAKSALEDLESGWGKIWLWLKKRYHNGTLANGTKH